jgi:hypothetical protein
VIRRNIMSNKCICIIVFLLLSLVQGNTALGVGATPDNNFCTEVPGGGGLSCTPPGYCRPEFPNVSNRQDDWTPPNLSDSFWSNCLNWNNKGDPTRGGTADANKCPPDCNTYACISPSRYGPLVTTDAACSRLVVLPWSWAGGGNIDVNVYEGVNFDCGSLIGINSIRSDEGTKTDRGSVNVFGGTIYTSMNTHVYGYGTRTAGLWVGGSENTTQPCAGHVNISGGLMVVPQIAVYYGDVNLTGGILKGTSKLPADLIFGIYPSTINVAGGTLRLKGDRVTEVQAYYATGHITPYNNRGGSRLVIDYNVRDANNYTTVTAEPDLGGAWNPNPANGAEEVDYKPLGQTPDTNKLLLTWNPGNWVNASAGHRVYFGTSWTDVNDANQRPDDSNGPPDKNVYKGVWDTNSFDINSHIGQLIPNTTYYWRIDEVKDGNTLSPWKGQVWSFTTLSGKALQPKPRNDSNDIFDINKPSLRWRAGVWASTSDGHRVFFGTDYNEVNDATTATPIIYRGQQTGTSYPLSSLKTPSWDYNLVPDATYYWRIDEVNNGVPPHASSPWKGRVWNFRFSQEYSIDDFSINTIAHWKRDVLTASSPGYTCPGSLKTNTGATLTIDTATTTMTYKYDNNDPTLALDWYSEARFGFNTGYVSVAKEILDFNSVDWTASAVPAVPSFGTPKLLYITYKGESTNAAHPVYDRMYVMLQDSAGKRTGGGLGGGLYGTPIQNPDPNATRYQNATTPWTNWRVLLSDLNSPAVDLKAIRYLFLGIGSRCKHPTSGDGDFNLVGGKGTMVFDNLRLSQPVCNVQYTSIYDFAPDCTVDITDFDVFARDWLMTATTLTLPISAPTATPVLWYDFNETSGRIAANSGSALHDYDGGVEYNTPTTWGSAGVIGGCINLPWVAPGLTGTYVNVPPGVLAPFAEADGPSAITFTFWVKQDPNVVLGSERPGVISAGDSNDSTGKEDIMIIAPTGRPPIEGLGPQVMFKITDHLDSPQMRHGDFAGRWNHYAFVKDTDSGYMMIYHNGQQIASRTLTTVGRPVLESTPLFFRIAKRWPDGTWGVYPGKIDDVRMYDVALTPNEIAYLATLGTGSITVDLVETTNLNHDAIVNFGDFALFANEWMTEKLWP